MTLAKRRRALNGAVLLTLSGVAFALVSFTLMASGISPWLSPWLAIPGAVVPVTLTYYAWPDSAWPDSIKPDRRPH